MYLPVVEILPHILGHDHDKVINVLVFIRRYTCAKTHMLYKFKGAECNQSFTYILMLEEKTKKNKQNPQRA